jgi:hypothetical protein
VKMSSIYEWHDRALALPGAPDIWLQAAEGKGLVTVDTDEGLYAIASDGTWWEPTGRADRPWVLAVDHPGSWGPLLALLGLSMPDWWVATTVREDGIHIVRASEWEHDRVQGKERTLGRACIATADSISRWPGGEAAPVE